MVLKRRNFRNALLVVLLFFATSISVQLRQEYCPVRATLPADAFPPQEQAIEFRAVGATSQWARKYNVNCQVCHSAFPRLNQFGEKFKRNGYQMPGTRDGDDTKEKVAGSNLFIDKLGHLLGLRINITPVKVETNRLITNGETKTRFSFGNPNWLQFFVAGSIFKDVSIFIETEILSDKETVAHNNWMVLGFHNLIDTSLFNIRVGKLSPMENFSQAGRLRMIPSVKIEGLSNVKSSGAYSAAAQEAALGGFGVTAANSTHDDEVPWASAQPAIEIFGYEGPFLYSVGVANGSALVDNNKFKNFFGTLRAELTEGALAGSNISGWGYMGWDTANNSRARQTNRFWRTAGGANLRWQNLDVIGAFMYGRDNNWDLLTGLNQTTKSISGQVGYLISPRWYTALQYDWVDGTDGSDDFNTVTPAFTLMPRENMRIDLIGRIEFLNRATGRRHEALVNVRSMF